MMPTPSANKTSSNWVNVPVLSLQLCHPRLAIQIGPAVPRTENPGPRTQTFGPDAHPTSLFTQKGALVVPASLFTSREPIARSACPAYNALRKRQ